MNEGAPIAYEVLDKGVAVFAADGEQVGTVFHVLAAPEEDVFHGLVVDVPHLGKRVVLAEEIASLHERGVDLKSDAAPPSSLPAPEGGAEVYGEDPGEMKGWEHWLHKLTLQGDWERRD